MSPSLGVCSWSLQPASPEDLAEKVQACGLHSVQLALDPIRKSEWDQRDSLSTLAQAGIKVASGMSGMSGEDYSSLQSIRETGGVRPDATWPENLAAARENAELAAKFGLDLVTFHAGFIPDSPGHPEWERLIRRLRELVDVYDSFGVRVGLETGQETAGSLLAALDSIERPTLGVNFDPANMVLYGTGNPVEALEALSPWVHQIHIKDATATQTPGNWGSEEPVGMGQVDWSAFFAVVKTRLPDVDLMIEREAGENRVEDIADAVRTVRTRAHWVAES